MNTYRIVAGYDGHPPFVEWVISAPNILAALIRISNGEGVSTMKPQDGPKATE